MDPKTFRQIGHTILRGFFNFLVLYTTANIRFIRFPFSTKDTKLGLLFQDMCHGLTQIVVSVAENHTKMILEAACSEEENKKSDVNKLISLVLVSA